MEAKASSSTPSSSGEASECRLLLGGDVMLGRGVYQVIEEMGAAYPFSGLAPITTQADRFMVNLECAITDRPLIYRGPPKAFYFRAGSKAIETLKAGGVHLVNLANNHALDADVEGLLDTLSLLDAAGILHVGAGENLEAAARPAQLTCRGLRLGVMGCCDHQEDFAAGSERPGIYYVHPADTEAFEDLLARIRTLRETVDILILSYHWMPNWVPVIPAMYRDAARRLVEAGVDILWGHSPHHFLGVEWMDGRVVLYSTGDLIDDYAVHPVFRNDRQLLFRLILQPNGVTAVEALPLQLEYACTLPAEGEARQWIIDQFARACREVGSRTEVTDDWIRVLPSE